MMDSFEALAIVVVFVLMAVVVTKIAGLQKSRK